MEPVALSRVGNMLRPSALRSLPPVHRAPPLSPTGACFAPFPRWSSLWPAVRRLPFFSPPALPTSSGCSCHAVSTSCFLSRRALVGVAVLSTWPSPHKLPDFRVLGTSWIRPGVRCRPCVSRSKFTCMNQRVREGRGSSSSWSSRPTTP